MLQWMKRRIGLLLAVLVLITCMAVTIGNYAVYGKHNLDSDTCSEFVLAQLLNEEGRLMTDSWYYSTELRLISPLPVYQLSLALFDDWHAARVFANTVLLLGLALSLLYLARGAKCSMTSALLCASVLVLPLTKYHAFLFIFGGCYTIWAIMTFIQLGLIMRMDQRRLREPVLLAILGFLCGLSGLRMLMMFVTPLLLCCVLMLCMELRDCGSMKEVSALPAWRISVGCALVAVTTFAGYLINAKVLAENYHFKNFNGTYLQPLEMSVLGEQIVFLFRFLGYRLGSVLLSRAGIASLMAILLPFAGLLSTSLLMKREPPARERLLLLFAPIAVATGLVINTLTLEPIRRVPYAVAYYIPALLLLIFAIFWMLDRVAGRVKVLAILPMLALVGAFLISNSVYRRNEMIKEPIEQEIVAELLLEENCTQGYATFWNANVITEISDGQIEVFTMTDWENPVIYRWLQRTDHVTRRPEGRVFAIFDASDLENGTPGCDREHLVYSSDILAVVIYDSDEEFHQALGR